MFSENKHILKFYLPLQRVIIKLARVMKTEHLSLS
jgi:hypothetical protein